MLGQQRCDVQGAHCRSNGWDQYGDVFRCDEFQNALLVTIKFALITVPLGVVLGVGLAVLADKWLRGVGLFRTVFSSTVATSVAVASLMWLFLLQPDDRRTRRTSAGSATCSRSLKNPGLLRDPGTALWSVALSSVWASLGFTFILVTAGAAGHPRELHEAAAIDGASGTRAVLVDHAADARPDAAVHRDRADHACLPGLRRGRPAHRWRAAAGGLDDDDHLPHLRPASRSSPTTTACRRRRRCCCSS